MVNNNMIILIGCFEYNVPVNFDDQFVANQNTIMGIAGVRNIEFGHRYFKTIRDDGSVEDADYFR